MNPSAYDLSELRDAAGVRERGGVLESVRSETAGRRRGLPPRIRGDEHRDEARYRELLARELELAGDPDPPYLRRLPRTYVGTTTVLDWVDFLVRKAGRPGAREALAFYEQQGWLADPAASSVRSHVDAVDGACEDTDAELSASDHQLSLLYVARLAALNER
jgi:flagellar protein FlaE